MGEPIRVRVVVDGEVLVDDSSGIVWEQSHHNWNDFYTGSDDNNTSYSIEVLVLDESEPVRPETDTVYATVDGELVLTTTLHHQGA